eukprot:s4577_g2.t1
MLLEICHAHDLYLISLASLDFQAMSYVDSQSVFKARCDEVKLSQATYDAMKARGWNTFGSYAFSVSTNPAQITDDDFDRKVSVPILGAANAPEASLLRRLLFESYTLTATELKRKADNTEADGPKKLPIQEIATRFSALEKKLEPLKIVSVLEPSHTLVNSLAQCADDGRLRYIEWSRCTSRTSELNNLKEQSNLKVWKADSTGTIKQTDGDNNLKCDASSELEVLNAMKRRGIAYELANLMSYEKHEMIVNLLFQELQREPLDGFRKLTLSQLAAADREIHVKLAEKTRSGLPLGPAGELPLDPHVESVLEMPAVMWLLMPKQKAAAPDKPASSNSNPQPKAKPWAQLKGGKFDKNRKKVSKTPMPAQLRGGTPAQSVLFPSVDVIQERPVANVLQAEGFVGAPGSQPVETLFCPREEPVAAQLGEDPKFSPKGERSPPFLLELFCGTAGVCAQFRTLGGRALGVDHHVKRGKLKAAAVQLDITQQWVQDLICREIRLGRIDSVHMGPPCGTASMARNIPIKRKLIRKGAPNPQPLRSHKYPLGFPWLRGLNRTKVLAANVLYQYAAQLALLCDEYNVPFTIENPFRSLMWSTPYFRPLLQKFFLHVIDSCEYGSAHRKETAFLANFDAPRLKQRCRGDHAHAAWKVRQLDSGEWAFDTAKEAEYPTKLAKELAASFLDELANRRPLCLHDDLVDHAFKISAESQPRRTKGPLLVAEFKTKVMVECNVTDEPPLVIPTDAMPPWQGIPIGAKRIDVQPVQNENGGEGRLKVVYGVYFSPEEFVERVQILRRPFDIPLPLDDANMASISFILEKGPSAVAAFRAEKLRHYLRRGKELQVEEALLHQQMEPSIQKVMCSKRLLLFKEMLSDAGVNDPNLFSEMCSGFKLVGDLLPSGQFQQQWKPAVLGVEQLKQTAVYSQKAVVASCKRVLEDPDIARAVWDETMEQAAPDKAWVKGPFSAAEVTKAHGSHWVPSRRFGVRQGGKVRAVDDFSQFLVNSTVTSHEKIDLEGIDNICSTARFFLGAMRTGSEWMLPEGDEVKTGPLNDAWKPESAKDLLGRCLDLRQAYKQLVRHPEDAWASILAVVNPSDSTVYFFEAVALPFGSVSSVLAFNRAARALRMILARVFKLVVTNFLDDFCQLELAPLCTGAWKTAELVLELLGWRISTGDDKRRPFAKSFEILGAIIALPVAGDDVIRVSNKESRLAQLKEQVDELKALLNLSAPRAKLESLKGRLLYAAGHTYGRCTQLACQLLHKFGGEGPSVKVTPELVQVVAEALTLLLDAKPRTVQAWADCPPILIFTDGAVEENLELVTHGAVLVDPWKQCSFYFGDHVPRCFVELWSHAGKKQVISQAEIFPVIISKATWETALQGRSVLWFLDNDSARLALIRNFSPVLDNFFLLQLNAKMDVQVQARNWYSRVPSKSNPSDEASRLKFESYRNSVQVSPNYEAAMQSIRDSWKLLGMIERGRL